MSTATNPGCVILLLDESAGMGAVMGEVVSDGKASTKSNAERLATAVNALLNQLTTGPSFDLALVGYQADGAGNVHVGSRFAGELAGRDFVATGELAAAPRRTETRTRKVPSGGFGSVREETVEFPIWYEPALGAKAPQIAAYDYCRELLGRWSAGAGDSVAGAPLVVHVSSGASGDGNPQRAVDKLMGLSTPAGPPILLQAHLAAAAAVAPSLYPSSFVYLTMGSARDLFRRASELPPHLIDALRAAKVTVNEGARGLIYNAKIADVIRLFSLVKAHTRDWPSKGGAPAAETPALYAPGPESSYAEETIPLSDGPEELPDGEQAGLVVLALDRSAADPYGGGLQMPFFKLQDQANEILKQISKLGDLAVDAAVVSYGLNSAGEPEVCTTFDGPLAGRSLVPQQELAAGAIRVEQFEEEVSNGIGGLVSVTRKKPIYFDLEPTAAASPGAAFAAVAGIVGDWLSQHPSARLAPVVVHLTRGAFDVTEIEAAVGPLQNLQSAAGAPTLYHVVATETPHKSLAYPADAEPLDEPCLKKLWELSSPLLSRDRLSQEKPAVTDESRGMVVNGKFDVLLEGVKDALCSV